MTAFAIRAAKPGDEQQVAAMQAELWPDASIAELHEEAEALLQAHPNAHAIGAHDEGHNIDPRNPASLPCVIWVAENATGALTGFVLAGLRSHADGCDIRRPVGFIEGWFVRAEFRRQGIGRALIQAAEQWARSQGCREVASDALIDNRLSHDAHCALGFEVVDRCVHFRKTL